MNTKFLVPLLALCVLAFTACSKEQQTLNKLKGRWKCTQLQVDGYPPAEPELETYLTFDACKTNKACLVTRLTYLADGSTYQAKQSFSLLNEDRFTLDGDTCSIVRLTGTTLEYTVKDGNDLTLVSMEKQ